MTYITTKDTIAFVAIETLLNLTLLGGSMPGDVSNIAQLMTPATLDTIRTTCESSLRNSKKSNSKDADERLGQLKECQEKIKKLKGETSLQACSNTLNHLSKIADTAYVLRLSAEDRAQNLLDMSKTLENLKKDKKLQSKPEVIDQITKLQSIINDIKWNEHPKAIPFVRDEDSSGWVVEQMLDDLINQLNLWLYNLESWMDTEGGKKILGIASIVATCITPFVVVGISPIAGIVGVAFGGMIGICSELGSQQFSERVASIWKKCSTPIKAFCIVGVLGPSYIVTHIVVFAGTAMMASHGGRWLVSSKIVSIEGVKNFWIWVSEGLFGKEQEKIEKEKDKDKESTASVAPAGAAPSTPAPATKTTGEKVGDQLKDTASAAAAKGQKVLKKAEELTDELTETGRKAAAKAAAKLKGMLKKPADVPPDPESAKKVKKEEIKGGENEEEGEDRVDLFGDGEVK